MSNPPRPPIAGSAPPRLVALLLPLALLAGCTEAQQPTRSEQAQYEACHRQADQIVSHANVDALSQSDPISSPYAATSILPNATNTLSIEHQRQDIMNDCMRHYDTSATNAGVVTATPSGGASAAPVTPPPADLAGPTGSDLTKPPILPAEQ